MANPMEFVFHSLGILPKNKLLRNLSVTTGIELRNQFDHNRVRINLFNQNNEQVMIELREPQLINDCKLRITLFMERVLKSFTIKFSSGLNFSQDSLEVE